MNGARDLSPAGATAFSVNAARDARVEQALELLARAALAPSSPMLDVSAVAVHLGVNEDYVYAHHAMLGARRLGDGPKARLRFSLADVDAGLVTCSTGRGTDAAETASASGSDTPHRRRRRSSAHSSAHIGVDLLPIRGRKAACAHAS